MVTTITAVDRGLRVGDTVRIVGYDLDWCKVNGIIGRITAIEGEYASSRESAQLATVVPYDDHRNGIVSGVNHLVKVSYGHPDDGFIGPMTHEEAFEARREEIMEAKMMGFDSPEDPAYIEAMAAYERYMEEQDRICEIEDRTGARQCPKCGNFSVEVKSFYTRQYGGGYDTTEKCHDPYCDYAEVYV